MQKYSKLTIPQTASKPGVFVLPFPEVFELWVCSGVFSTLLMYFHCFVQDRDCQLWTVF